MLDVKKSLQEGETVKIEKTETKKAVDVSVEKRRLRKQIDKILGTASNQA